MAVVTKSNTKSGSMKSYGMQKNGVSNEKLGKNNLPPRRHVRKTSKTQSIPPAKKRFVFFYDIIQPKYHNSYYPLLKYLKLFHVVW